MCELKQKEVININDGKRLGFVNEFELDIASGRIKRLIIQGQTKFLGLLGREIEYSISWNEIKQIGDDIILIDVNINKITQEI